VAGAIVGRGAEQAALQSLLDGLGEGPATLALWGEAGIGKTTIWAAGVAAARSRGHAVFQCRPAIAELRLTYAGLTDLLAPVDDTVLDELPGLQRRALEAALLRGAEGDPPPDPRGVATGLLSVFDRMTAVGPVLVAIDDLQWLDEPTRRVVEYAIRRAGGPLAVLTAERTDRAPDVYSALCPADATRLQCVQVGPMSVGALHRVLRREAGRTFSRPTVIRVAERSGGNPFFALQIARSLPESATSVDVRPTGLKQLVAGQVDALSAPVREALVLASAAAEPRVELIERALGDDQVVERLAAAEDSGLIEVSAGRVRFTHPLWASAVYDSASPARQRIVHRRLSEVVDHVEERARHLALAATGPAEETLRAVDAATDHARRRGSSSAAAELAELAIRLGASDPALRVRAAHDHFDAGDASRAKQLLEGVLAELGPGLLRADALGLLGTLVYEGEDYARGIELLEQALIEAGNDPAMRASIALELGMAVSNAGRFADLPSYAAIAEAEAEQSGDDGLLAEALAACAMSNYLLGQGLDKQCLERGLALEDPDRRSHAVMWPSLNAAVVYEWTHCLDQARAELAGVYERCVERGAESDLWFVLAHLVVTALWCGDVDAAEQHVAEMTERAHMSDTDTLPALAMAMSTVAAAWSGRVDEVRSHASDVLDALARSQFAGGRLYLVAALGRFELSVGNPAGAVEYLQPAAATLAALSMAELATVYADAAEALIGLGRLQEAEPMLDRLTANGRQPGGDWTAALALHTQGQLFAARGELDDALGAYDGALAAYTEFPEARFERARTLLAEGQLRRRRNERRLARASFEDAARLFDEVAATQWAARTRAELDRLGVRPGAGDSLTAREEQIAALAASGLTNREVAATLCVSAKTVEANLARAYRKLGIRTRAELGRYMAAVDAAM
jgi:ATP/maltotriose-dependent transcriptional regulator MalT